ncbi:hypothetical protein BGX29_009514 [Mortierella sp. GBA35]|nr:hypothetical protein BGX29_009514 [Mortierella sp. GBA35]
MDDIQSTSTSTAGTRKQETTTPQQKGTGRSRRYSLLDIRLFKDVKSTRFYSNKSRDLSQAHSFTGLVGWGTVVT